MTNLLGPNFPVQQPAGAGGALEHQGPSVAWPVCCSESFGEDHFWKKRTQHTAINPISNITPRTPQARTGETLGISTLRLAGSGCPRTSDTNLVMSWVRRPATSIPIPTYVAVMFNSFGW